MDMHVIQVKMPHSYVKWNIFSEICLGWTCAAYVTRRTNQYQMLVNVIYFVLMGSMSKENSSGNKGIFLQIYINTPLFITLFELLSPLSQKALPLPLWNSPPAVVFTTFNNSPPALGTGFDFRRKHTAYGLTIGPITLKRTLRHINRFCLHSSPSGNRHSQFLFTFPALVAFHVPIHFSFPKAKRWSKIQCVSMQFWKCSANKLATAIARDFFLVW